MTIDAKEVAKVAQLARLDLDPSKTAHFAGQMNSILEYMEQLSELDTSAVDPMYTPVEHHTVLREDVVRSEYDRDEILDNAPETDCSAFIVPKVV